MLLDSENCVKICDFGISGISSNTNTDPTSAGLNLIRFF